MSNFREELEKILTREDDCESPISPCHWIEDSMSQIIELVKGVIGKDEEYIEPFNYSIGMLNIRNGLRHEQLAKLEEGK